ncbi:Metallo-hydrolase/oxidoreductase [Ceraceosorus guamensis]|uniref:hydroxyacylglutathione hydrolase n=1 Tax=Ceraceosorus guamensis TaxID=1522189 RepID=A0A316W434_9BASI|nr:Metallo-hydrolase/oxidoreductase [Ceraceosorus guamensis]PWN43381.1 Metallo-hydrolase/oxidoreductase [Ceraceosorus guamensis]
MKVTPVAVRDDNYAYIVSDGAKGVFVDPYDLGKVQDAAQKLGVSEIVGSITTHHHFDHSGGNEAFAKAYPSATVWGGSDKCPAMTKQVKNGDSFPLWQGSNIQAKIYATPCHTQDSHAFFLQDEAGKKGVFTGESDRDGIALPARSSDSFCFGVQGGCGRFFEGTPEEMHRALNTVLASLPDDTIVYCGHEYTGGNIAFGIGVLPQRKSVQDLAAFVKEKRNNGVTTGVFTIADEKKHNVFMLVDDEEVAEAIGAKGKGPVEVMRILREYKNNGKMQVNL